MSTGPDGHGHATCASSPYSGRTYEALMRAAQQARGGRSQGMAPPPQTQTRSMVVSERKSIFDLGRSKNPQTGTSSFGKSRRFGMQGARIAGGLQATNTEAPVMGTNTVWGEAASLGTEQLFDRVAHETGWRKDELDKRYAQVTLYRQPLEGDVEEQAFVDVVNRRAQPFIRNIGLVRYLGPVRFGEGLWAGIELDCYPVPGGNDGAVGGRRYFTCDAGVGMFVPSAFCRRSFLQRSRFETNSRTMAFMRLRIDDRGVWVVGATYRVPALPQPQDTQTATISEAVKAGKEEEKEKPISEGEGKGEGQGKGEGEGEGWEADSRLPSGQCPPLCSPVQASECEDASSSPSMLLTSIPEEDNGKGEPVLSEAASSPNGSEGVTSPLSEGEGSSLFSPFDASPFAAAVGGEGGVDTASLMAAVAAKYGIQLGEDQVGEEEEAGDNGGQLPRPVDDAMWSPLLDMGATERSTGELEQEDAGRWEGEGVRAAQEGGDEEPTRLTTALIEDAPTPDVPSTVEPVSPRDVEVAMVLAPPTAALSSPPQPQEEEDAPLSPLVSASPTAADASPALTSEEEQPAQLLLQPEHRSPTHRAKSQAPSPRAISPSSPKARPATPLAVDVTPASLAQARQASPSDRSQSGSPTGKASPRAAGSSPRLKQKGPSPRASPLMGRREASAPQANVIPIPALVAEGAAPRAHDTSPDMMTSPLLVVDAEEEENKAAPPQAHGVTSPALAPEQATSPSQEALSSLTHSQADALLWGGTLPLAIDPIPTLRTGSEEGAPSADDDRPAFLIEAQETWPQAVSPARQVERASPKAPSPSPSPSTPAEEAEEEAAPLPPTACPLQAGQAWPTFMIEEEEEEEAPSRAQDAPLPSVAEEGDDWLRTAALSLSPSDAPGAPHLHPPVSEAPDREEEEEAAAATDGVSLSQSQSFLSPIPPPPATQAVTGGVTVGVTGAGGPLTPSSAARAHIYFSPKATKVVFTPGRPPEGRVHKWVEDPDHSHGGDEELESAWAAFTGMQVSDVDLKPSPKGAGILLLSQEAGEGETAAHPLHRRARSMSDKVSGGGGGRGKSRHGRSATGVQPPDALSLAPSSQGDGRRGPVSSNGWEADGGGGGVDKKGGEEKMLVGPAELEAYYLAAKLYLEEQGIAWDEASEAAAYSRQALFLRLNNINPQAGNTPRAAVQMMMGPTNNHAHGGK